MRRWSASWFWPASTRWPKRTPPSAHDASRHRLNVPRREILIGCATLPRPMIPDPRSGPRRRPPPHHEPPEEQGGHHQGRDPQDQPHVLLEPAVEPLQVGEGLVTVDGPKDAPEGVAQRP